VIRCCVISQRSTILHHTTVKTSELKTSWSFEFVKFQDLQYIQLYRVIQNDSPDATPCDFFLWGYVKDQVYVPPLPASILELKVVTRYKQFGTNSIIVLIFVESQRVHI
jgi:hypothetical protein